MIDDGRRTTDDDTHHGSTGIPKAAQQGYTKRPNTDTQSGPTRMPKAAQQGYPKRPHTDTQSGPTEMPKAAQCRYSKGAPKRRPNPPKGRARGHGPDEKTTNQYPPGHRNPPRKQPAPRRHHGPRDPRKRPTPSSRHHPGITPGITTAPQRKSFPRPRGADTAGSINHTRTRHRAAPPDIIPRRMHPHRAASPPHHPPHAAPNGATSLI